MRAVAVRLVPSVLATTEIHGLRHFGFDNHGSEIGRFVRAVTKRLVARLAALAPVINAGLEVQYGGLLLSDFSVSFG